MYDATKEQDIKLLDIEEHTAIEDNKEEETQGENLLVAIHPTTNRILVCPLAIDSRSTVPTTQSLALP